MAAPMANVRVKLMFPNPTENCWFLINTSYDQIIGDVEKNLSKRFDKAKDSLRLYLDGCWLPTEESTLVLRDNDSINVRLTDATGQSCTHTPTHGCDPVSPSDSAVCIKHKKNMHKKKSKEDACSTPATPTSHIEAIEAQDDNCRSSREKHKSEHKKKKKRKSEEVGEMELEESYTKKRKRLASIESTPSNTEDCLSSQTTSKDTPKAATSVDAKPSGTTDNSGDNDAHSSDGGVSGQPRRKRKRRKRKTSTKTAIVVSDLCSTPFARVATPASSATPSLQKPVGTDCIQYAGARLGLANVQKHVHFGSDQESPDPTDQPTVGDSTPATRVSETMLDVTDAAHFSPLSPPPNGHLESATGASSEAVGIDNTRLHSLMENLSGYKVVPPPSNYTTAHQHVSRVSGGRNKSSSSLLQGAQVFNRQARRCKKSGFVPLSKEEQLNTSATNCSTVFQNGLKVNSPGDAVASVQKSVEPAKDYTGMQKLCGPPREKDKIAYKVLQISDNCTPEMSDYQEATVLRYDVTTKMVHLELLKRSKVQRKPLPFDVVVEDEEGILTNIADDNLKSYSWTSLVDVCLLPLV